MKKFLFVVISLGLLLNACLPATATQSAPAPSVEELNATAAVLSQLTLQALPTQTIAPSNTPVVATATKTPTQSTPTETSNPILLTLTATLGTGTVTSITGTPGTPTITPTGTLPTATPSVTPNPAYSTTPSETPHPQHYGTMPPNLPFGTITLINKAKKEVYISLQCTTNDGEVTIIEYPVDSRVKTKAPAGHYFYVAWVGTKQMTGNFGLEVKQDLTIKIYEDQIEIK